MTVDARIEREYVFSARYPERSEVYRQMAEASAAARADWPCMLDLAYGPHLRERIDLFPGRAGLPLLVFIHGGYWRSQEKSSFSFVAPTFLRQGISVAVIGYPLAPEFSVPRICASIDAAVHWLGHEGRGHLPAVAATVLCGHSAGGHLAALAAGGPTAPAIAGCVTLSGLFDLTRIVDTSIASAVRLDIVTAMLISPISRPRGKGWLLAAVGSEETSEFELQSAAYVDHWSSNGGRAETLLVRAANHYTILMELQRERSPLVQRMLGRMGMMGVDLTDYSNPEP